MKALLLLPLALVLTITSPKDGSKIDIEGLQGKKLDVAGKVKGDEPITVTVNGERALVGPAGWRKAVRVRRGKNTVKVVARDGSGAVVRKTTRFRIVAKGDQPGVDTGTPRKRFEDPNDSRGRYDVRSGSSRMRGGKVIHKIVFWDRLRLRKMIGPRRGQISVHIGGGPGTGAPRWEALLTGHNGRLESLLVDHATGARVGYARFRAHRKTLKVTIPKSAIARRWYALHVDTGYVAGKRCPVGTGNAPTKYRCADRAGFGKVKLR